MEICIIMQFLCIAPSLHLSILALNGPSISAFPLQHLHREEECENDKEEEEEEETPVTESDSDDEQEGANQTTLRYIRT